MATRYFKNSVDQNWDTLGNWWSNAACDEGFSGTLTGVNVTDTDTEVTCDSTAGLVVGRPITGDGIDTGTTVASITDGTTFELSQAAISTETSDLTCELHVIPVTADDVVIATGNGYVMGTPSADMLGLVTVNGTSGLQVTLRAANFVFNDTSSSYSTLNYNSGGGTTFNDSSSNWGDLYSTVTFNDLSYHGAGYIYWGGTTFNDSSFNSQGTINGDATFNDSSSNSSTINGDPTFNDSSINLVGTITGNPTFNDTSYNASGATVTGNPTFNDTSYNASGATVTGNPTFNDTSYHAGTITGNPTFNDNSYHSYGTITGNASFTNTAFSTATTGFYNPQQGAVSGWVDFPNGATFTLVGSESWSWETSGWTGTLAWEFNDNSYTNGIIYGDCTFAGNNNNGGTIYGDCTFSGSSYNNNGGTITGDCTFSGSSYNNNGNNATAITGNCTFNDSSYNNGGITGNVTFNDTSYNVNNIAGNASFNGSSYNNNTITGNASFNDSSYNNGIVSGNATFTGSSYNDNTGIVYGTAYVRQHAAAFVAWRNYATYTGPGYHIGTLTLQFPEMDILGTGLL
jgi:hypothetical protein